jgi:hypothetical protein
MENNMSNDTSLLIALREIGALTSQLADHEAAAKKKTAELSAAIAERRTFIARTEAGLDLDKIAMAETVVFASDYSYGGDERDSARQDAIKWFAGTLDTRNGYADLRQVYFGTKNYDRWRGQRSDHSYGMGPRHGGTCFRIELMDAARKRDLTDEEKEAAIYYLLHLEAIQKSRVSAAA